ncbi:Amidase [Sulfobacillus acidophilus TPY]|nr:Amidase [Sulfobacillus acidophilus TPY]
MEVFFMASFDLLECTVEGLHSAIESHEATVEEVVDGYLARIEQYNPELHAVVTVNPDARDDAKRLDEDYRKRGGLVGPLHGVPVVVKDQVETRGIRTTFGSVVFDSYVPSEDATIIKKLRDAGAVILAKSAMPDFAASWFSFSSVSGETKNPFALSREPGGSSSGTAVAVTTNLGMIGIGEDTGGSVRVPASFTGIFGLRVTTGMISRTGLSPLVHFQDTPGPMARTVKDLARLFDGLVGYDPSDPMTVAALYHQAGAGSAALSENALKGTRIGVLRQAFGPEHAAESAPVNARVTETLLAMKDAGAEIIDPVAVPDLDAFLAETAMYALQSKSDIDRFLRTKPETGGLTFDEIYRQRQFHEMLDLFHDIAAGPEEPETLPDYFRRRHSQMRFREAILNVLAQKRLDALLFPDVQVLPPTWDDLYAGKWTTMTFPTNTLIASQSGLPALSMPGGLTDDGLPVGVELIGKPYDEPKLLALAYAYEQIADPRRMPKRYA